MKAGIVILSTRSSRGEREDLSTPTLIETLSSMGFVVAGSYLIEDSTEKLKNLLIKMVDEDKLDLIITSGGTGLSPLDVTPEGTLMVLDREAKGIAEAIRIHSLKYTPMAMLSRGVAGIRNSSLIINLPGSPRAIKEILEFLHPAIMHALPIIQGKIIE
ncbi:MAG: Molybdopterin adenylyltransferase [candidate division WS2 bacterium]|uniref:Molybdopterin adenylyltransferase n=1 Tax=Psychracetigena formicireducens TaxID=2986056 RepID=A0A9E2F649_PSYF1|nr:Molybdopterin adenylyltransferase [Candidatus Psychracetigena formicireducens]MBT9145005.1 Molybdopterin adenylyltransferase [Candidatus Psychracetigena formicireducens]MBT9150247.1 Molybdopterin adenylyltransferase [Candidatus Psychracetigena formicireducens]